MARNLRWRLPFKSATNISCRVDIYDNDGWTGTVTTLTGGDKPVVIEEDDDDDLLSAIRFKTGTIKVFQPEGVDLSDIIPILNNEHYIEIYRGPTIICKGFLQAMTFSRTWDPSAQVIELPFTSPLGLADSIDFSVENAPYYTKLQEILREVLHGLDANYTYVTIPDPLENGSLYPVSVLDGYIDSNVLMSSQKNVETPVKAEHWKASSYADYLEMLCAYLGCIVHDNGIDGLVFQKIDYDGSYSRFTIPSSGSIVRTQITELTGASESALLSGFTISGEAKRENVLPLSSVEIERAYNDYPTSVRFPFDQCFRRSVRCEKANTDIIQNIPVNNNFTSANLLPVNGFWVNSSGVMSTYGAFFCAMFDITEDTPSADEIVAAYCNIESGEEYEICRFTPYGGIHDTGVKLKVKCAGSGNADITRLQGLTTYENYTRIRLYIRNKYNNHYYDFDNKKFQSAIKYKTLDNDNDIDIYGTPASASAPSVDFANNVEFIFKAVFTSTIYHGSAIFGIKSFSLEELKWEPYEYMHEEDNSVEKKGEYPGFEKGSVELKINPYYYGIDHSRDFGSRTFQYILHTQHRLEIPVQGSYPTQTRDDYKYLRKYTLPGFTDKFRLIAEKYDLREDEYTLTVHGGQTI